MTLEKAIEVLAVENKHPWNRDNSELREAVKLGIEALKLIKRNRRYTPQPYNIKLPGETKE